MTRYIAGRVLQAVLVLWIAYTVTFLLLSVLPGDGIMIKFEDPSMGLSNEQIALIREYYRVDDPLLIQYLNGIIGALHGDFGYSISNAVPVRERLAVAIPQTLLLAVPAFVLAVLLAAVLASLAAFARVQWLRRLIQSVPSVLASLPVFWLGLILIQVFSFQLRLVPMINPTPLQAVILPMITLAIPITAPLSQLFLRSLDEVGKRPFIQVVQSRGAGRWWTFSQHTAKNALLPTLTIGGLIFAELLAGSVVIETVFGRTGLGRLMSDSVGIQDLPVIQAVVILAAVCFVTANLIVDLLYPVLDPRLRRQRKRPAVAATTPTPEGLPA